MKIAQVVIDAKIYHHQCVVAKKKTKLLHITRCYSSKVIHYVT